MNNHTASDVFDLIATRFQADGWVEGFDGSLAEKQICKTFNFNHQEIKLFIRQAGTYIDMINHRNGDQFMAYHINAHEPAHSVGIGCDVYHQFQQTVRHWIKPVVKPTSGY